MWKGQGKTPSGLGSRVAADKRRIQEAGSIGGNAGCAGATRIGEHGRHTKHAVQQHEGYIVRNRGRRQEETRKADGQGRSLRALHK
jgi:hypothetical protein